MADKIHWLVNKRIITAHIAEDVSADVQESADQQVRALLDESVMPTSHLVLDCTDVSLPRFRSRTWIQDSRVGWVVVYGIRNPLIKLAVTSAFTFLGIRYHFAEDKQAALRFLEEVDITLSGAFR